MLWVIGHSSTHLTPVIMTSTSTPREVQGVALAWKCAWVGVVCVLMCVIIIITCIACHVDVHYMYFNVHPMYMRCTILVHDVCCTHSMSMIVCGTHIPYTFSLECVWNTHWCVCDLCVPHIWLCVAHTFIHQSHNHCVLDRWPAPICGPHFSGSLGDPLKCVDLEQLN